MSAMKLAWAVLRAAIWPSAKPPSVAQSVRELVLILPAPTTTSRATSSLGGASSSIDVLALALEFGGFRGLQEMPRPRVVLSA